MIDERFSSLKPSTWQKSFNQALQGTDLFTISPTNSDAALNYEFELPNKSVLLFGPLSGFLVRGAFQSKSDGENDDKFTKMDTDCGSEVALVPNWFEHLIEDIKVYHGSNLILANDVPKQADPFLNTYLYAHMQSDTKDCLFPEPHNPGRCVGQSEKDWSFTDETCVWRKYSKIALEPDEIVFRFVPPFQFPFYQDSNFCLAERPPIAVPMQVLGKMSVVLRLKEKSDGIFLRAENNSKHYRFNIKSIHLIVEEARLNSSFEKRFLNRKEPLIYPGMTRIGTYENINTGVLSYRSQFSNVPFPEGVFVFALPMGSLGSDFKWEGINGKIFKNHNIESMSFKFQNKCLGVRTPMIGDYKHHFMAIKQFLDHCKYPPFGVCQEHQVGTFYSMKNGGDDTIFPHLYFNLTPSGKDSRIIPVGDDGHIVSKPGDLDITLNFGFEGASNDAVYLIYIFYTDANIRLDMKTRQFKILYKKMGTNA